MRSSTLVLLFLISVQAALNMGEDAPTPPTHHPHHTRHHHHHHNEQQHQRRKTAQQSHTQSQSHTHSRHTGGQHHSQDTQQQSELIPTVDPKLFNKRRYRSPRVLFSDVTPADIEPMGLATADKEQGLDLGQGLDRGARVRRRADQVMHRGEYSVCDSVSHWVENMTRATDMKGNEVTVLTDVRINNVVKKQLFFETTCVSPSIQPSGRGGGGGGGRGGSKGGNSSRGGYRSGPASSGCRGIDSRYWTSYCTNTHTYVRALTTWRSNITWRYIRINAACVCVISRKSWKG